jgi:hypothetical protein
MPSGYPPGISGNLLLLLFLILKKALARATLHFIFYFLKMFVDEKFHAIRRRFFDCAVLEEPEPGVL